MIKNLSTQYCHPVIKMAKRILGKNGESCDWVFKIHTLKLENDIQNLRVEVLKIQ